MKTITKFEQAVYDKLREVPRGRVTTYGMLARAVQRPHSARAVGNALNKNPFAPRVPCHRVVKSNGFLGGFATGPVAKSRLLKKEGVMVKKGRIEDFNAVLYKF